MPHAPQFDGSVVVSTHAPPHDSRFPGQPHTPLVQAAPGAQALPHAPQFCGSFLVFTHWPLAQIVWPGAQLHTPPEQL